MGTLFYFGRISLAAVCTLLVTMAAASADSFQSNIPVGVNPQAIAVNPVTNKIYVANCGSPCGSTTGTVTVINGADHTTVTVPAGIQPRAVAVNPVTNKVYVGNGFNGAGGNSVTVINGADNTTVTVAVGIRPRAIAVNPVTNKIYVTNEFGNNLTVINGADNTTAPLIPTGTQPFAVAVNQVTNKIYVTNFVSNNVTVINGADNTTTTVAAGTGPTSVAVNPVTNKIYVPNRNSGSVTVINGANNTTAGVVVGAVPRAVVVNPVTNRVYVANEGGNNVTVINGADNTTATVATGGAGYNVAVNPMTNKIYVANPGTSNVSIIDGGNNTITTTIATGTDPLAVAVNPVTNKIYVANGNSANVTVIDGAHNTTVTVSAGKEPRAIAANPVTNKIYVANRFNGAGGNRVTVINGADNTTQTITAGTNPFAVAVNPVTNKIYVANLVSANVTVINGADNTTQTITAGSFPKAIAVNPVINKIFVPNGNGSNVAVINGADNTTSTVTAGTASGSVEVNPVTNRTYVGTEVNIAGGIGFVTVITEQDVQPIPLTVSITPQAFAPNSTSRSFTFTASSTFMPTAPPVQQIHYQVDTWTGTWQTATPAGSNTQSGTVGPLQDGVHIVYAYATDGGDATSTNTGSGNGTSSSPLIGPIQAFVFFINSTATSTPTNLVNIATRMSVQTGDNRLIAGFIVTGSAPKKVIVRALGPSLNVAGVPIPGRLGDTTLQLVGPGGPIATNDNWRTTQQAEIIASTVPPPNDLESAIVATLPANNSAYTAIVEGAAMSSGIGSVEVYDLDQAVASQLANISTRGLVQAGDNVMIGGIIVVGPGTRRVIVRALGPSLNVGGVPIPGRLPDSTLEIANANGMILFMNDDWRSTQEAEIIATTVPPPDNLESAIVATLPAAPYTAIVRGKNGATGIGQVEVYALTN